MALDELMFSPLANLEHEEPLAINLADHCPLAKENGASTRLQIKVKEKKNKGSAKASIDHADAEGVH